MLFIRGHIYHEILLHVSNIAKDGIGSFTDNGDGTWTQHTAQKNIVFTELIRRPWVVPLVSDKDIVLIDLQSMQVTDGNRIEKYKIIEVTGPNRLVTSHVNAPAAKNCGGLFQKVCLDQPPRCEAGLVEIYLEYATCGYTIAQNSVMANAKPIPVVYPTLDPTNPEHAKLLAGKIMISIIPSFGNRLTLTAKGSDTIYSLRRKAEKSYKVKEGTFRLGMTRNVSSSRLIVHRVYVTNPLLDETLTLAHYNIQSGTSLVIEVIREKCSVAGCEFALSLYPIAGLSERKPRYHLLKEGFSPTDTVVTIKQKVKNIIKLVANDELYFEGQRLEDNRTLGSYGFGQSGPFHYYPLGVN